MNQDNSILFEPSYTPTPSCTHINWIWYVGGVSYPKWHFYVLEPKTFIFFAPVTLW